MHAPLHVKTEKGIALLFTVLLTSMLLLVAIGITNISYKEAVLAREASDSDVALYAADTGVECGLYLDKLTTAFPPTGTNKCDGVTLAISSASPSYAFSLPFGASSCVDVKVHKDLASTVGGYTQIQAFGYNVNHSAGTSCLDTGTNPNVVVRSLSVQYSNK